jgi:UPF0042 nucleotide-binding protein
MAEYLIVAGLSGAGRSTAAATFEDLGWFVIDNLPPSLIAKVAELTSQPGGEYERICLVAGRGGAEAVSEVAPAVARLRRSGARVQLLFLDAPDDVLVRRFEGTRRRHPLDTGGLSSAIAEERALLDALRRDADLVIDTGELNVHELRDALVARFAGRPDDERMEISVVSFGFAHGLPLDADLVLDCRFLPNPHWVEELRPRTGLDAAVASYVLDRPETVEFLARLRALFELCIPAYEREGKSYLSIAIGCTGGRHRSVAVAEAIAAGLAESGRVIACRHRDIDR